MPENAYLTIDDVAELLQVSHKTVRRLVWRGEIPAFKVGNQWRFIGDQIRSWAEEKTSSSPHS